MTFTITTIKKALNAKSKAQKELLIHKVSIAAMAAADPKPLPDMKLERRAIKSLEGLKKRVRKTEKPQLERVAHSLRTLGQRAPILIDDSGVIINGHIVAQALQSLGQTEVWCAVISQLDESQRELLHVTLNRLSELGNWDIEALRPLLIEFDDIGIDLSVTGFSLPELDIIMTPGPVSNDVEELDKAQALPTVPVTILNDLWSLGKHRLLCADATNPLSYTTALDGEKVDLIFTDIPWNIPADQISPSGKHKNFKMGSGELSGKDFAAFCDAIHQICADQLAEGAAFFSCIDWRSVDVIMAAGRKAGLRHITTIVWNKGTGAMGSPYRSAHELVVMFGKGDKLAINNVELGKHGRDRTNVWSYPGANQPGSSASKALAHHPTPKPVEMVEDALKDVTKPEALVLDPFLGSGTTLLAAERSRRRACCIELDPAYVDVAIQRWEAMTGQQAVHVESGKTYEQMALERAALPQQMAA